VKNIYHGFLQLLTKVGSLGILLCLTGCELDTRMSTFKPKGPIAQEQLDLFMLTVWVTLGIFIAVGGTYLYVVIKFRERANDDRPLPKQGHGNPLVEIGLIGISILLLVIIAVPTLKAIWYTHTTPNNPASQLGNWYTGEGLSEGEDDKVLTVKVIGYQWWWAFEYPQLGITTANEMIIPAGKAVHLELRSVDVIHSFWLPRIAGKVDLIPGRTNSMWIQAGDTFEDWQARHAPELDAAAAATAYESYLRDEIDGYYYGQCAEYCGDSHARMLFRASVVSDADFAAWVADHKQGNDTAPEGQSWADWYATYDANPEALTGDLNEGLKLFVGRAQCNSCHAINGNPRVAGVGGPDLTNLAQRLSLAAGWLNHHNEDGSIDADQQLDNLTKWIHEPDSIKPGNLMWVARDGRGIGQLPVEEQLTEEESRKIALYLQTLK
jgi:cytochrome c oxidase subunit 2